MIQVVATEKATEREAEAAPTGSTFRSSEQNAQIKCLASTCWPRQIRRDEEVRRTNEEISRSRSFRAMIPRTTPRTKGAPISAKFPPFPGLNKSVQLGNSKNPMSKFKLIVTLVIRDLQNDSEAQTIASALLRGACHVTLVFQSS